MKEYTVVEQSKMDALDQFESERLLVCGNMSSEEVYHGRLGFLKGFTSGFKLAHSCDGCINKPSKEGEDPYPDICGTCSRFYGDMHSKFFMEDV
jgi:hypothetical protein